MQLHKRAWTLLSLFVIASMILVACAAPAAAPAAPAAPAAGEATAAATEAAPAIATVAASDRAKTLIMDIDGGRLQDPEGVWNMYLPSNRRDQGFHQVCLEPLFILNYQTGEFIPWLGESFTSNEAMDEWTLKLRDGITWQDGVPLTAADVVFTMNMLMTHAPDLQYSAEIKDQVASVEKVDDLTVKFKLTRPNPRFQLDNFAVKIWGRSNIVPEHIWKDQDPLTFKNYDPAKGWPVCSGPYKLASTSQNEVVWKRDDNWWGAKTGFQKLPEPETIIWTWAGPPETRAALMANHQLDSLMDITLGAYQALKEQNPNVISWFKDLPYAWVPDPCSRTLEFNDAKEPWNDKDLRWAVNYAINRDDIVKIAYEGSTLPSKHFFPQYPPLDRLVGLLETAGMYEKYPLMTTDPDKAKQLIESKGYKLNGNGYYEKDGKELTMDIATNEAFIEKKRIAEVLVEELQKIGINASTRSEAGTTWTEDFVMGNFDARMGWQTCGSVNEPWASMDTFNAKWVKPIGERTSDYQNAWRWSGPNAEAYSKIVDEIGALPLGDPKIDDLFVKAMDYWFQDLPVIPITQAKKIIPFDTTYWTGWPTYDDQYIHPPTWWQSFYPILENLKATGAQ